MHRAFRAPRLAPASREPAWLGRQRPPVTRRWRLGGCRFCHSATVVILPPLHVAGKGRITRRLHCHLTLSTSTPPARACPPERLGTFSGSSGPLQRMVHIPKASQWARPFSRTARRDDSRRVRLASQPVDQLKVAHLAQN